VRRRLLLHVQRRLLLVALPRRLFAEFLGTGLLVAVVVGSGIAAQRLTGDVAVQLLVNSLATAAGLAVLILVLLPISRAHFNPVVSIADWWLGRRRGHGLPLPHVAAYSIAQVAGAVAGAVLANAMFSQRVSWSQHTRSGWALLLSEVVATAGLVFVIFALAITDHGRYTPVAVGAWIGAAYWWTSSTSFANPAATVGRAFTDTFAGIAPKSVLGFVAAQVVGLVVGLALIHALLPDKEGRGA
jgi:glycerol uptake facilitator-like aquaporin